MNFLADQRKRKIFIIILSIVLVLAIIVGACAIYKGLVLLGSYSTADLSQTDLDVLSIYGSEDEVMNREEYDENKSNLPDDYTEIIIDGGCHAYFGMFGKQDGDGTPTITNEKQIRLTVENIVKRME